MTALDHALKKSEKILASKGASKHACRFTLWVILTAFVDLGYGIHPTQRVPKEDDDFEAEVMASIGQEMRCAA